MKYDLGFGNSFLVRELLFEKKGISIKAFNPGSFDYDSTETQQKVIDLAKYVFSTFMGIRPYYVGLSHGATGGITAAIRSSGASQIIYSKHYFPYYPKMVAISKNSGIDGVLQIIDSPSNPEGLLRSSKIGFSHYTVFDGAYHNPIYLPLHKGFHVPQHDVAVGSFGKLFGLNGIRLGFYGTDSVFFHSKMEENILSETAGLSVPGMELLLERVRDLNIVDFTIEAGRRMDDNRNELSRLERFFESPVPDCGMFYFPVAEPMVRELLEKAGIKYIDGIDCGSFDGHIRLSLGQTRELTKEAVEAIIKADRV